MKNTITSRQAALIACILIFANKVLTLPSLLYEKTRADSIFTLAIIFSIDLLVLFVFFRLKKKYQTETLFEVLSMNLSKPVAIFIYITFFVYYFVKLLLNFNFTHVYFKAQVYHDDQESVFLLVAVVIMISAMVRGFRPIARTIEFFYFAILYGFVVCMFIALSNFHETPIMFDSPVREIFSNIYHYAFAFGDTLFFFLIMDKIKLTQKGERQITLRILVAMLIVIGGYFLFYSVYQYTVFAHPNAVSDIIVLSYQTTNLGRLEIISVIIIMLLTLFQISLYAYFLGYILRQIFHRMSKNLSIAIVTIIFLGLYVLFFNNLDILVQILTGHFSLLAMFLQYVFPLVCVILLFSQKQKRRQT